MKFYIVLISTVLFGFTFVISPNTGEKDKFNLDTISIEHKIQTDSGSYLLVQVLNENNIPKYYFREIETFPCHSEGECYLLRVRIYWDLYGNFLQYELSENEELTKLNHNKFSEKDYKKLHKILNNSNSDLQFCKFDDLTSDEVENNYHSVDAVSSATVLGHNFDYINGAIKTTYTLWNKVNCDTQKEIISLTNKKLNIQESELKDLSSALQKELCFEFEKTTENQKIIVLNRFLNSDSELEKSVRLNFLGYLCTANGVVYNSLLMVLEKNEIDRKEIKSNLEKQLDSNDDYKQIVTYNLLQKTGNQRLVKKYVLPFRNLEL